MFGKSFLQERWKPTAPLHSHCVRGGCVNETEADDQGAYLRTVCVGRGAYRWTTVATVCAAEQLYDAGHDVPVSGDAGLVWIGPRQ